MNNKSFLVSIAMIIMAGCVSEDDALLKTRVPISLTTSIAPTRATQDVQIGDGQEVYIWANEEEVSGTTNWDANNYIEAWHLTANATGGLTSANTYYYPTRPLSMVAIHGNFEFDEGKTQFPGVVSHTILADQSTAANLMKSDLLWWKGSGITSAGNPGGIPVTFAHNLSKIEITLSSDFYTTDQLNAMEVSLCNVLPTVDLSLADGTTNAAHGTRITVTPLKPSANSPTFEAVIPAQARPDNFIVVRLDGGVVNVDAQVSEFAPNTRYPYNLDITYRDVRKNPLWYVAEYNVNYDGSSTYSWATTPDEGYYFSWSDAMKAFTTRRNASSATPVSISEYYGCSGCKFAGWHLPSQAEWWSISPGGDLTNIWTFDSEGTGTYKASNQTVVFGYNSETQEGIPEASYWKKISSNELHALRFIGSDYCSAWKYVWDVNNGMTVYATLVDKIENNSEAASSWYTNRWNSVYFGNNYSIGAVSRTFGKSGFSGTGSGTTGGSLPNSVYHWTTTSQNANDAYVLVFAAGFSYVDSANDRKAYGRRIRLFRVTADIKDPHLFSVAADRQVEFAPGNLQFLASTGEYRFALHPWDYIGNAAGNNVSSGRNTQSAWIDLFGWGTSGHQFASGYGGSYQPWSVSETNTDYGPTGASYSLIGTYALGDWGQKNPIGSDPAGTWRTPTKDEWVYVFNTRTTTSGIRYAKAKVAGIPGIILLPDDWSTSYYSLASTNTASAAFTTNTITESQWNESLEPYGAVFLPAAGYRYGLSCNNQNVDGNYWSSTVYNASIAYDVHFTNTNIIPNNYYSRYPGKSVRLIR